MAKIVSLNPRTHLSANKFDEQRASERFSFFWEVSATIPDIENPAWLQAMLEIGLREDLVKLAHEAIEYAHDGDDICDAALRTVGADLHMLRLQGQQLVGHSFPMIETYYAHAALRGPRSRRGGRPKYKRSTLVRDLRICLCIEMICREFGLCASRDLGSSWTLSAIGVARDELDKRHGIPLTEETLQRKIWFGLAGTTLRRRGTIR